MVKNFKGLVKITDVQEAFDDIISTMNTNIDKYNNALEIQDIDYTKGANTLAPLGYCLTAGGLKQFLEIYDGWAFGFKAYRLSSTSVKVTGGIIVHDGTMTRVADQIVNGSGTMLYYNPKTGKLEFAGQKTIESSYSLPSLSSNTSYGAITANTNANNAWKITQPYKDITSNDELTKYGWGNVGIYNPAIAWTFPKDTMINELTIYTFGLVYLNPDNQPANGAFISSATINGIKCTCSHTFIKEVGKTYLFKNTIKCSAYTPTKTFELVLGLTGALNDPYSSYPKINSFYPWGTMFGFAGSGKTKVVIGDDSSVDEGLIWVCDVNTTRTSNNENNVNGAKYK